MVRTIREITDSFVAQYAESDPIAATFIGIGEHDNALTDYSPDGYAQRAQNAQAFLDELNSVEPQSDYDRLTKGIASAQVSEQLEIYRAEEHLRGLNILFSPLQNIRQVFDLMAYVSQADWANVAARMQAIPPALAGYRHLLNMGVARGKTCALRQVTECAKQATTWASGNNNSPSFFTSLCAAYTADDGLRSDLLKAAAQAASAYADFARYLEEQYRPHAVTTDAVGSERYQVHSLQYSGIELDLLDTYQWGWSEVARVRREMERTAHQIFPNVGLQETIHRLNSDSNRTIVGTEEFRQWMQDLQDETIEHLDGVHFDILEPVKTIEALIAPAGGALAMYYTGPSEDFTRPGRTWYPVDGKTEFPLWREVSIAYHEGTPGHHFQTATTVAMAEQLGRYRALFAGGSGYVEGWALYAEKLMGELGYLSDPAHYLGMLDAQVMRSARVVIDIGMHLQLLIPKDQPFHQGEYWTPQLGLEFMVEHLRLPEDFMRSEIVRYLGIPGQAISYKVGERVWLQARQQAKQTLGARFDLKSWHNRALDLGPMGLAQLKHAMQQP